MTDFEMEARLENIENAIRNIFSCLFTNINTTSDEDALIKLYSNFDKNIKDIKRNPFNYNKNK